MKPRRLWPILVGALLLGGCEWAGWLFIAASQDPLLQPLIQAVGNGDVAEVDRLLAEGAPLEDPLTLQAAVLTGQLEMARHLVDRGAPVNGDGQLESPLWYAVTHGDLSMAELMISLGADVDWQTGRSGTPLHTALYSMGAQANRMELVRLLVEHGVDVNRVHNDEMLRDECLATALHSAVFSLDEAAVTFLIDHGADLRATDRIGRTPLQCARERLQTIRDESMRPQIEGIAALLEGRLPPDA